MARMAADGMTNRDIAQALFVTQKTVEMHLGSVYRKLGVRSRRALPGGARLGLRGRPSGRDVQGAAGAVQELGDGVGVHAEPVADLVVGEVAELAQHPRRALALGDGGEGAEDGVAGGAVERALLGLARGRLERLDVRAGLAQRVERGVAAPPALQVEARVARGARTGRSAGVVVAAGVDAAPGEVE